MVRKITVVLACMLLLLCGAAATASATDVYQGTISSNFYDIFDDIYITASDDYVFFRSGQYEYILLVGDLDYDNNRFDLAGDGKIYKITQNSGNNYNTHYTYEVSDVSSYFLNTKGLLVYSNMGDYPTLNTTDYLYGYLLVFVLVVLSFGFLLRPLFNFVLRLRRG